MKRPLVAALALTACQPNLFVDKEKEPIRFEQRIPVTLERKLDLLWVVDDSGAMGPAQAALADGFPSLLQVIDLVEGGRPDLHMGVVSSNVGTAPIGNDPKCAGQGDDGVLQLPEGCPLLDGGARFIEDVAIDSVREVNYGGSLEDQFACMARLGTQGCGFEQHLESMRRALENEDENAGFLRRDALLAVVFVQDEDDCSAFDRDVFDPSDDDVEAPLGELSSFRCFEFGTTCEGVAPEEERTLGPREACRPDEESTYIAPPARYVRFLEDLKGDPSRVMAGAIAAPPGPVEVYTDWEKDDERSVRPTCVVCPDVGLADADDCPLYVGRDGNAVAVGYPPIRMAAFTDAFAGRSTLEDMCHHADPDALDFRSQLRRIGGLIRGVIGTPCLESEVVDGCTVTDVARDGLRTKIPTCDSDAAPCYRLVRDRDQCPWEDLYPTGLRIEIQRGAIEPADGTVVEISCPLPD